MSEFKKLYEIDVKDKIEQKNGLNYLSWSWAWAEFKKVHPTATYEVKKFENDLPYLFDPNTGYMVMTSVTVDELTHDMWLPVMDGSNKAMKDKTYTIKTKYKQVEVQPATMFDINKAIMRCLTKNLAMFGLGLYIYAGEDLPEQESELTQKHYAVLNIAIKERNMTKEEAQKLTIDMFDKASAKKLTLEEFKKLMSEIEKIPKVEE